MSWINSKLNMEKFQNLSVNNFWLPLTQQLVDNHNLAWHLSNGDDEKYVKAMLFTNSLLEPLYGKYIDLNKVTRVFIYVLEFKIGDPYSNEKVNSKKLITTGEMFNLIKNNWDVDIDKELKRVKINNNMK